MEGAREFSGEQIHTTVKPINFIICGEFIKLKPPPQLFRDIQVMWWWRTRGRRQRQRT